MMEFEYTDESFNGLPEHGQYLGTVSTQDIFSLMNVEPLLEEYEVPMGVYMLGNAGGIMGSMVANELITNYNIEGMDIRFYAMNTARVDLDLLRRRFPKQLLDKLRVIPIGIKKSDYYKYLKLVEKLNVFITQYNNSVSSGNKIEAQKILTEIKRIKTEIKNIQRRMSGSGSLIDTGISKFNESYDLLDEYFSDPDKKEDAQILIGSFAGGSGSALFVELSKLLKKKKQELNNTENLLMAYGLAPFRSERHKNSLKMMNYMKAVQGTRPNVNLLVEVDPSALAEQLSRSQGRSINFFDLNSEFGRKIVTVPITIMMTNRVSEFSQVTNDFRDLRRFVGDNSLGDMTIYDNKTPNGGYLDLMSTVKEKLIPDLMGVASRVMIFYNIPKSVSVSDVEQANITISESLDTPLYFGVTQRTNDNDKEIQLTTIIIKEDYNESKEKTMSIQNEYSDIIADISSIEEF